MFSGVAEHLADIFQHDRALTEEERGQLVQALVCTHKHAHRGRKPEHRGIAFC